MVKKVLIVDDDPKSMKLSYDMLGAFGYRMLTATNGQEAVEIARAERPDLILMDIQLPVIDGITATRMIKADEATKNIQIIAATAYAMNGDREKVMAAGCDGYLTKPIDIQMLLLTVEKCLAGNANERIECKRSGEIEIDKR